MKKLSFGQKSKSSKDPPEATPTTGGAAATSPTSGIPLDNTTRISSSTDIPPMVWKSEPEMTASVLSGLIFLWIQPMFSRAAYLSKRGLWLEKEDLPPLANMDRTIDVERIFQSAWLAHDNNNNDPPKEEKTAKKKTSNANDATTTAGSSKDGDAITAAVNATSSRVNTSSSSNNTTGGESPAELESRLLHALIATCKRRIIEGGIYRLINSILQFSFPILLNLILAYYQDIEAGVITKKEEENGSSSNNWAYYRGYWLSVLLMLFIGTKALTESAYFHKMNRCSWRIKTAVSASIYRKSLRLSSSAQRSTSVGEIVNLMQVDATKIEVFVVTMHTLWDGLFQIAGYMTILGFMIGWPCLVGLLLIIIGTPIMGIITSRMFGLNRAMVEHTDERVKTSNEALQGILCVKMYGWEGPLSAQIDTYRHEELCMLRKIAYLRAFSRAYMSALPTFAAATTFLVYVYATAGDVSASIIFSSIVAFDMLRLPLMFYPNALAQYAQAKVSLRRVATFLGSSEVNTMGYTRNMDSKEGEIIVDNATLYWYDPNEPLPRSVLLNSDDTVSEKSSKSNKSQRRLSTTAEKKKSSSRKLLPTVVEDEEEMVYPKPVLNNVNIHVSTGELCAIVGPVGSGKSTLCSAILNEAVLGKDSHICLTGSVAYVSQTAWILNRTVRENILFGQVYDESRYDRVIDACCLRHDLRILEDGDSTEIGERGINLSGGQKQRVSLARAAYANADVYIFDDPLSALDPEVAEIVFDECILGMLRSKTRLLVTNQLQFLSKCDSIIALGAHGHVLEQGTYSDLMTNSDGEVTRLLKNVVPSRRSSIEGKRVKDGSVGAASAASPAKENKKLISSEERQTGTVKFDVYLKYIKAGGGYVLFSAIFFFYLLSTGSSIGSSVWISVWTADSGMGYEKHSETFYIVGYAIAAILIGVTAFIRSYGLAYFGTRSSFRLHGDILRSVLRAPMSFFDTTPTGRILSRFSRDIYTVDNEIADSLDIFVYIILQLTVVMVTIMMITPFFAAALPFLGILYISAMNYFRRVSREVKRLETITRSPVYSLFSETLGGLPTIRAYGKSMEFNSTFDSLLDSNTQTVLCARVADRWLAVRLESIAAMVVGLAAVFATQVVVGNGVSLAGTGSYASLAGVSLSFSITATGMMQFVVRSYAMVESAMTSVERVLYYSHEIPQEAAMTSDELDDVKAGTSSFGGKKAIHTTKEWPESGSLTLSNLQMRYRTETPLVLKGLNVSIGAGERIGVVGRTGSGKSSMLLVLMRIVEPLISEDGEKYEAPISIDGVDVMRIGLYDLRSKLGIIPQSPVLFSGTIRSNLDPFSHYTDEVIYDALEKCMMKDAVDKMSDGLQSRVAEYGENLSQGQRQLLCLGRALLRNCKILLLDEATSSVDYETDRAVQKTIREAFNGCTIITIAHRVNTILDSDKILVMDNGQVGEFDTPQKLLADKESLFSAIVNHSE